LDIPSNRRVLAIGAHPDDVEILCAGLLLLLTRAGYEAHIAMLAVGDCGSADLAPEKIAAVRRKEAERACRLIGARYHCLGFRDLQIFNDDVSNRRVTALMREVNPGIVITHPPSDYMADHEGTSVLVRNACFAAPAPNYDTSQFTPVRRADGIPYLYYTQPVEGVDLYGRAVLPGFYCDISDVFETKLRMLASHESQREWLRQHHGMDEYLEAARRWTTALGARASLLTGHDVGHAEGFRQHRGHAYPQDNVLASVLPDRIIAEPEFR